MPPPGGGGKRGRGTKVSLPRLTPQPFLRTRLPSVARLKTRGPQGRSVPQSTTLDRSEAFRSRTPPPCTEWPRTVMRGKSRKLTSGPYSIPKANRRPEPSPRNSRFAARPQGVAAQRRVWGSQEGAREPYGALAPFCPSPWARRIPPVNTGTSAAGRRQCLRHVMANIPRPGRACLACGGKPPERRNRFPSAEGKERNCFSLYPLI